MTQTDLPLVELLDDETPLTLAELCRITALTEEQLQSWVAHGIVEPLKGRRESWHFTAIAITRVNRAKRLQQDLGLNTEGAALALDLLDEIEQLRRELHRR